MPKQNESPPRPPVEHDAERVAAAIRRLTEIGCAEDAALHERSGGWPSELHTATPNLVHAIINPGSYACILVIRELIAHLGTLIGPAEAQALAMSYVEDQKANPAVRATIEMLDALSAKAQASAKAAAGPSPSRSVH